MDIIVTERLRVGPLTEAMAESVHLLSLDGDNRLFLPDEVFETVGEAREAVAELIAAYGHADRPQVYAVTLDGGTHIGHVQAVPIEEGWEIGYHIGREFCGQGYASEAVRAFLPWIMEKLRVSRPFGVCRADNAASRRVLQKCGFELSAGQVHEMCRYLYAPVETERLRIRPYVPEDGAALYAFMSRAEVVWFEPYGPYTEETALREAERRAASRAFHAVCLKDGTLIGNLYLSKLDFDTWTLGYVFNPDYGCRGYATEAARALVTRAFIKENAHRVAAECNPDNTRSWKLLARRSGRTRICMPCWLRNGRRKSDKATSINLKKRARQEDASRASARTRGFFAEAKNPGTNRQEGRRERSEHVPQRNF